MADIQFINDESRKLAGMLNAGNAAAAADELRRDAHMTDPQTFHDLVRRTDQIERQYGNNAAAAEIRHVHVSGGGDDLYVAMRGSNMGYPAGHMIPDVAVPIPPQGYAQQPGYGAPGAMPPEGPMQGPVVTFAQPQPGHVQFLPAACRPKTNPIMTTMAGAMIGGLIDRYHPGTGALVGGAVGLASGLTIDSIEKHAADKAGCRNAMPMQENWEAYSYQQQLGGMPVYSQYPPVGWQPPMGWQSPYLMRY